MVAALMVKVKLSDLEIDDKYEEFMTKYPQGKITKEEFVENGFEENGCFPTEQLFCVFDEDHNRSMDFSEYMLATNCTNLSSKEENLPGYSMSLMNMLAVLLMLRRSRK